MIDIFEKLKQIPEDIVYVIGGFLPLQTRVFLNKENYETNQRYISYRSDYKNIRKIIRNDFNYLFCLSIPPRS